MSINLVSLNIEGRRHYDAVRAFLVAEQPEVLCLQEVPEDFLIELERLGYHVTAAHRCTKQQDDSVFKDFVVLASRLPHTATTYHYYTCPVEPDDVYDNKAGRRHNHQALIFGEVDVDGAMYRVATTHFTWTADGLPSPAQARDLGELRTYLDTLPGHVLCGDFNIPRQHNQHYEKLREGYTDAIPLSESTSLDAQFHKIAQDPNQAHLVDEFMVDYVLVRPPFEVTEVRLLFGMSDHAAVTAMVTAK